MRALISDPAKLIGTTRRPFSKTGDATISSQSCCEMLVPLSKSLLSGTSNLFQVTLTLLSGRVRKAGIPLEEHFSYTRLVRTPSPVCAA